GSGVCCTTHSFQPSESPQNRPIGGAAYTRDASLFQVCPRLRIFCPFPLGSAGPIFRKCSNFYSILASHGESIQDLEDTQGKASAGAPAASANGRAGRRGDGVSLGRRFGLWPEHGAGSGSKSATGFRIPQAPGRAAGP